MMSSSDFSELSAEVAVAAWVQVALAPAPFDAGPGNDDVIAVPSWPKNSLVARA